MASPQPTPSPPQSSKSSKLDYYYFVIGLALVAIVLLVTNAIAVGCCSWLRHFVERRGVLGRELNDDELRRSIPAFKYRKKEQGGGGGVEEGETGPECAVCLSAFDEGDEVRKMPQCGHAFHAACIDMWLCSHTSCPVCRGSVVPTPSHSMEMSAQFHSRDNLIPGTSAGVGAAGGIAGSV